MKKLFIVLLASLLSLIVWFFTWNSLQELAYSGDGVFKSQSGGLGPLLTNYSIKFPAVKLNISKSYQYRFKRFPSNNSTYLFIDIEGLTSSDIDTLPEISVIIREDKEIIFERNGKLNFDSRYDRRGKVWVGLKTLGKARINTNWLSEYEIDLHIQTSPNLEKDLDIQLRLVSGWK